jgi:uncharacterized RDD family membrane protein YckC
MVEPIGGCAVHPERSGSACVRCGTFACDACRTHDRYTACWQKRQAELEAAIGGVGVRFVAELLDFAVLAVAWRVCTGWLFASGRVRAPVNVGPLQGGLVFLGLMVLAKVVIEPASRVLGGASLGELLMRLRIVTVAGDGPLFAAHAKRGFWSLFESGARTLAGVRQLPLRRRPADEKARTLVVASTAAPELAAHRVLGGLVCHVALSMVGALLLAALLAAFL